MKGLSKLYLMSAMTKLLVSRLFKICLGICLLAVGTIPTQARFDAGLLPMWFEMRSIELSVKKMK